MKNLDASYIIKPDNFPSERTNPPFDNLDNFFSPIEIEAMGLRSALMDEFKQSVVDAIKKVGLRCPKKNESQKEDQMSEDIPQKIYYAIYEENSEKYGPGYYELDEFDDVIKRIKSLKLNENGIIIQLVRH